MGFGKVYLYPGVENVREEEMIQMKEMDYLVNLTQINKQPK